MAPRTALLFQTHFFDRSSAQVFGRLRRQLPERFEASVLIHLPLGVPIPERLEGVPHHVVRTPELHHPAYPTAHDGTDWDLYSAGRTDLILLHFARAHPDYDRYWVIEYDVRFSGHWRRFFAAFEAEGADLIAPILHRRTDLPERKGWAWPGSRDLGDSVTPPRSLPPERQLCAFMPIYRVTRAGLTAVDAAWRAGWVGHSEAVWPTAIAEAGLCLIDPGGEGPFTPPALRGRFYTCTPREELLSPGTLALRPPLYCPGKRPDMLWHPVKPFWVPKLHRAVGELRVCVSL
jgi:hypothetical protein